jgi:hypothetical protein
MSLRVIEARRARVRKLDFRKRLTGSVVLSYTRQFARQQIAHGEEEISMMTTRTYKEHAAKWQPSAAMRGVCLKVGLGLSRVNTFNGKLGQATSIDSRYIRQ